MIGEHVIASDKDTAFDLECLSAAYNAISLVAEESSVIINCASLIQDSPTFAHNETSLALNEVNVLINDAFVD